MSKIHIHACPLCGSSRLERELTCKDYYVSGELFEVVRCADCGFLFTQDFPAEAEIGRYYETPDYISHSDTKNGLANSLYHWVRRRMLGRKARLVAGMLGKASGTLLDIGTGTGYFPAFMKQKGWEVKAVEKNAGAREFARKHFGLEVGDESCLDDFASESFDAVTLWHVMEHLEHLDRLWENLFRMSKDKGILFVAVPNHTSYDAGRYGEYWAAYDVPRHLWHFAPDTMQQWGSKHGFILAAQYPMPFDTFYVSILSERYKGNRFAFLRGMYAGMVAWLHALPRKERSSSMIYVFRKKNNGKR